MLVFYDFRGHYTLKILLKVLTKVTHAEFLLNFPETTLINRSEILIIEHKSHSEAAVENIDIQPLKYCH